MRMEGLLAGSRLARRGFSLLELLVAVSIFGVAMAALSMTQVTSIALSRNNQDVTVATDAALSVLEALRDEPAFTQVYARWDADVNGTEPGNAFDVLGLEPASDDLDGRVGEVIFPGDGTHLYENEVNRVLGMPRDLDDLDGSPPDADDHALDYRILPVMVQVRWVGAKGVQQIQVVGTLARR